MGTASIVNDQLSFPKDVVSDTDILLRRRMTETKYNNDTVPRQVSI